jgi:hypothetical protein
LGALAGDGGVQDKPEARLCVGVGTDVVLHPGTGVEVELKGRAAAV